MQHGFAHGLAGDGAGVDRGPADHFHFFYERGFFAEFRRLNSGALARRSGTNYDNVVLVHNVRGAEGAASILKRRRKYTTTQETLSVELSRHVKLQLGKK
jgi:hypothetical protein